MPFMHGETDAMGGFTVTGPAPESLGSAPEFNPAGMPESRGFATLDTEARAKLLRFVGEADEGFRQYTRVARASGAAYLDGNQAAQVAIADIDPQFVR
jgi:hypothetical protein